MYSNLNDSINQLRLFFNNDLTSLSVPELTHNTPTRLTIFLKSTLFQTQSKYYIYNNV